MLRQAGLKKSMETHEGEEKGRGRAQEGEVRPKLESQILAGLVVCCEDF